MTKPQSSSTLDPIAAVLGRTPSGIFVLTARAADGRETGMLASWVQQASFEPPMVTVAVNRKRFLHDWLAEAPQIVAAVSVTRALGLKPTLDEGSTDSNVPISLGVAAVTIDGGGASTGTHSLEEEFDTTNSWQGTARALLLALALAR